MCLGISSYLACILVSAALDYREDAGFACRQANQSCRRLNLLCRQNPESSSSVSSCRGPASRQHAHPSPHCVCMHLVVSAAPRLRQGSCLQTECSMQPSKRAFCSEPCIEKCWLHKDSLRHDMRLNTAASCTQALQSVSSAQGKWHTGAWPLPVTQATVGCCQQPLRLPHLCEKTAWGWHSTCSLCSAHFAATMRSSEYPPPAQACSSRCRAQQALQEAAAL